MAGAVIIAWQTSPALYPPQSTTTRFLRGQSSLRFGAQYFNYEFGLSPATENSPAPAWVPELGKYNQSTGYNIFKPNERKCWQAVKDNGAFEYWNQDNKSQRGPEDWELFVFEDAGERKRENQEHLSRYVDYEPSGFECTADVNSAAVFTPET
jgi:hypothetical protein